MDLSLWESTEIILDFFFCGNVSFSLWDCGYRKKASTWEALNKRYGFSCSVNSFVQRIRGFYSDL